MTASCDWCGHLASWAFGPNSRVSATRQGMAARQLPRTIRGPMLAALLGVGSLTATLLSVIPAQGEIGCDPAPPWIAPSPPPESPQEPFSACFDAKSNQAEALLDLASNRDYPQLITVSGAKLDLDESAFSDSLDADLASLFGLLGAGESQELVALGPGGHAMLTIDRPAPEEAAQDVQIAPAPQNASALSGLAWAFLSTAAARVSVSSLIRNCLASAVFGAVSSTDSPSTLKELRLCADRSVGSVSPAGRLVRRLARRLFSEGYFEREAALRRVDPTAPESVFTIPSSPPDRTTARSGFWSRTSGPCRMAGRPCCT